MAYKLIWFPAARDDLHDMVVFIARDNPNRAMSFGYELISETDRLQEFLESGCLVPECRNGDIARSFSSELIRTISCDIARVWHSARGILQLLELTLDTVVEGSLNEL